jgi:hypothetical protein
MEAGEFAACIIISIFILIVLLNLFDDFDSHAARGAGNDPERRLG